MTQEATYPARYWLDLCVSVAVVAAGISCAIGSSGSPVILTFGVLLILAGGAQTADWGWSPQFAGLRRASHGSGNRE
jgi:hypothetical protein